MANSTAKCTKSESLMREIEPQDELGRFSIRKQKTIEEVLSLTGSVHQYLEVDWYLGHEVHPAKDAGVMPLSQFKIVEEHGYGIGASGLFYSESLSYSCFIWIDGGLSREKEVCAFLHEYGHFLNYKYSGSGFIDIEHSISNSKLHSKCESLPIDAWYKNPAEYIARAYTQYIYSKNKKNYSHSVHFENERKYYPYMYWEDKDFRPIGKEFDIFFRKRGIGI